MKYSTIYIIPGYGIPKNIKIDDHYRHYLGAAFNKIFDLSKNQSLLCIFTGGRTDMIKPYRRNEASEMKNFFDDLSKRPAVIKATRPWKLITETSALSTLENILFSKKILDRKNVTEGKLVVFCEYSRAKKINTFVKKIFGSTWKMKIIPIDFDISQNRYQSELIAKRETYDIKIGIWALENPKNLRICRTFLKDKLSYLRKNNFQNHPEAVKKYWETKLAELDTLRKITK
jgi:hypothetical protein